MSSLRPGQGRVLVPPPGLSFELSLPRGLHGKNHVTLVLQTLPGIWTSVSTQPLALGRAMGPSEPHGWHCLS